MANKYISNNAGALTEVEAITTSAGAGDSGKIPALDGAGKLSNTMMPTGVSAETASIEATENLAAGDLVNLHDSTGIKVRKADASNGRRADGFVLDAVTAGANATVYFEGANTAVTGLTVATTLYLSGGTAGAVTTTAPSTATHIVQQVGRAHSTTAFSFEPGQPITLA